MFDVGFVYNICVKGMKSGKICLDFVFIVVKIYIIFFFEVIGDFFMCVIILVIMCIFFLFEVRYRIFLFILV